MRVSAVVLVVALLAGTPAFAQGISVGVKGGVNFATIGFTEAPDAASGRWFGLFGACVVVPVHWGVSFQPEVLYTMKGTRLRGAATPSLLLDYLEVPMLARVSTKAFGTRIYIVGGPAAAFRVRARTRTQFSGSTEEIDVSDQVERFDLGVAGGGGLEFGSLVIDGRYTFGLSDIDKDHTQPGHAANRVLSVTAGWRF